MRLENLYSNFGRSSPEEQAKFVSAYRLRRATDLAAIPTSKKTITVSKVKMELTPEEKAIMKMLGLKQKDVLALRGSGGSEVVEEDKEAANLFKDDTYEEGED